jgi:hypothetical protein
MPEAEWWSRVPEAEVRHRRGMAYNGSRLRLMSTNGNNDNGKDCACKIVLLGCHGVGKTGQSINMVRKSCRKHF